MIPGGGRIGARRLLLLTLLTAGPATATGQELASASDPNPNPRAFVAADVSMGVVLIENAEPGIGFTVGADISNLIFKGFSTRFAFRLWASETIRPRSIVELDDFAIGVMQRLYVGEPGFALYGGIGLSMHIISARIRGTDLTAPRNGVHPGFDLLFGCLTSFQTMVFGTERLELLAVCEVRADEFRKRIS